MNDKLRKQLTRLENSRLQLKNKVAAISPEHINESVIDNHWTLGQVLYHLYLVDRLTLQAMQERVKEGKVTSKISLKHKWRALLLKIALRLPLKFRAPSSVEKGIPDKVVFDELMLDWQKTREELKNFIEQLPTDSYDMKIFRHPRIGMINLYQTLAFIQDHFDHHLPQIKNLLSKY